ncbi:MAG: porin [Succinivibrio sp.]
MKKSLLAVALTSVLCMAVNAATVYDKDGTTLNIGGRVQSVVFNGHYNYAGEHDSSLVNSSRLSVSGKTKILDWVSAYAFSEWDMPDGQKNKIGDHIKSREQYVGADFGDFGKIQGGKTFDVTRSVMATTDIWEDIGIQNDVGLNGDRRTGVIRYDLNTDSGVFVSANYQTASDSTKVFGVNRDIENGAGIATGYTFSDLIFGPLSVKLTYSHLKGQDDATAVAPYKFDKANHTAAAISWGLPNSGLFMAALYFKEKTDFIVQKASAIDSNDNYGYEFVAGYTFDSGLGLFAGYNCYEEEQIKKNGVKESFTFRRIPVQVKYGFNSNFKVWTEAEFDANSDTGENKLNRGTQLSAGARYTF